MKKILFIAALLSTFHYPFSTHLQAQDAVYKLLRQEWTVNADGTSDYHYRHEVQILRNRALTAYADKGETFVVYNPELEELTVNEVYTLQKDGTRVEMPQNAFVYQLPSECADCGRFNHLRELAMVHTGMELGCTIVVDYTLHRRYDLLYEYLPLTRECPVERYEVKVQYPQDYDLNCDIAGLGYLPQDKVKRSELPGEGDAAVRTLLVSADDLPQTPAEPYLPADIIPVLHLYNGVPVYTPAFDRQGLAEANETINRLTDNGDAREVVAAIQHYVVDNIHLNAIAPARLGYRHATAAEVWQTGCGTATDKAVLLAAMLNEAGYPARVTGDRYDEVGVTIDTMEYRLGVRRKGSMTLYGEASDEVKTASLGATVEAPLEAMEDGFYCLRLPEVSGAPSVKVASLALVRTAPLQSSPCDLKSDMTYLLPKGVKLVGGSISRSLSFDGIGSVQLSVKQSGKKLQVKRTLKLEQSVVPVSDFSRYRQLLALWQDFDRLLLR